jgi:hypothetical protein
MLFFPVLVQRGLVINRGVRCFHDKHLPEKIVIRIETNIAENEPPGNENKRRPGRASRRSQGKKVGEVSVTYSSGASSFSMSVQKDLADLTETSFGPRLLLLLKLCGVTRYVP